MAKEPVRLTAEARSLIDWLGVEAGPEHLERDLTAKLCVYLMDRGRWHALDALAEIATNKIHTDGGEGEFDGIHPATAVPVPWWTVRAVLIAWSEWKEGQSEEGENAKKVNSDKPSKSCRWAGASRHYIGSLGENGATANSHS